MAEPDCASCEASGFRACDECGNVIFSLEVLGPNGEELCVYCLKDAGVKPPVPAWAKNFSPEQLAALGD